MNPQSDRRLCSILCTLFIALGALGLPEVSQADIDLLGRTQATIDWQPPSSGEDIVSYDVYVACGEGQAPDTYEAPFSIPAESRKVTISAGYGWRCRIRVAAWDQYGRVSPVSLASQLVNFVEPPPADDDFDGDGTSDIVGEDPDDGSVVLIPGSGLNTGDTFLYKRTTVSTAGNGDFKVVKTGDFDGDGSPEYLWVTSTVDADGITTKTYRVGDMSYETTVVLPSVPESQKLLAVADFNGDGRDDLLHQSDDLYGTVWVTFMGPNDPITRRYQGVLPSQFDFVASGDFNGDGNHDIMWRRLETGQTVIWLMADAVGRMTLANSGVMADTNWAGEVAGNFNNSPEDDVLWRNESTGEVLVWYMDDLEHPEDDELLLDVLIPSDWKLLASGDINKDGRADLTWFDPNTSLIEVWRMDEREVGGFTDQ